MFKSPPYNWQGRYDEEDGALGCRWFQRKVNYQQQADLGLLGLACDLGVSNNKGRTGAKQGPEAIRQQLANLAWHHHGYFVDHGDINVESDLNGGQRDYAEVMAKALNQHLFVVGLGGGHEIGWASFLGLRQFADHGKSDTKIGILNFDAHFDLRIAAPDSSSGTPFRQIAEYCQQHQQAFEYRCLGISRAANTPALFHYAEEFGVDYLLDRECEFDAATSLLADWLKTIDLLYVTVCLDALPASVAPGVSSPSALGIAPEFVIRMLEWLNQQHQQGVVNWPLLDIAELNPDYDVDSRTAKMAARLIFEVVDQRFTQQP